MYYTFLLSAGRTVAEANYNTFVNPALHPNRVMRQHDFLYILDGEWEVALEDESGGEVFRIARGDLLILPAGLHHYGTRLCSANLRSMYIHTEVLPGDCPGEQSEYSAAQTNYAALPSILFCGGNIKIRQYFAEIIEVFWGNASHKQQRLSCLFDLLLCELSEQEMKSPAVSQYVAFVSEVALFLQVHSEKFYSVPDVSQRFQVSEKTLNKRFKAIYGKTFYAWQMDQKLEAVYQCLHNHSDITLREMAINFGFCDEFHLSRAFKKKFGVSPRHVR